MKKIFCRFSVIICAFTVIGCQSSTELSPKTYLFSGQDDTLILTNGVMMINHEVDLFYGGELVSSKENLNFVQEIEMTFRTLDDVFYSYEIKQKEYDSSLVSRPVLYLPSLTSHALSPEERLFSSSFQELMWDNFWVDFRILYSDGTEDNSSIRLNVLEVMN